MIIKSIKLEDWNQFENVNIQFHPNLTVLTGANGAGKSTILRMFSRLIGWGVGETATPFKRNSNAGFKYRLGGRRAIQPKSHTDWLDIGDIELEDGQHSKIHVPDVVESPNYGTSLSTSLSIRGLNIPSHRTAYTYRQVTTIPVRPLTRTEAFHNFNSSLINRLMGNYTDTTPTVQMKSTLISWALFGKGNDHVVENEEAYELFLGFIEILKILLPPTLGFEDISIREGEVVLVTNSGEFLLDAVSGGIGAVLDLAWQIYMFNGNKMEPFVVLIDEAENHLHASMQRRLMPSLIQAFPNVQFIISTHSPLMVNSIKDSSVYVLKYNDNNSVVSELLDFENKAANATEILRDVLGVPVTMPIWVEDSLKDILESYRGHEITAESYIRLKEDLSAVGLNDHLPQALGILQGGTF
ncbi:AAA family ATPase [Lysinibacillus sp. NPDC097214]|uniref:AAA family ATPase n=1 Tax=Lysinibacillus sp. NPDC097214 TaxID=3390584 RepID=UPI003D032712